MSQTRQRIVLMLILAASCMPGSAQTTPPPAAAAALSLHDCLALAATHQLDILVGKNSLEAAKARVTQARSSYYPQLSVQANIPSLTTQPQSAGPISPLSPSSPSSATTSDTLLVVSQTLFDGGTRAAQVADAKSVAAQASAELVRAQQTATYSVTKAYFGLLRAQQLARVGAQQVIYIDGQLQMVQARIDAGKAADVEALPLKAQLANARVDALTDENSVHTAAIQLQQAIGLSPADTFAIQDVELPTPPPLAPLETCLATALHQRPEVLYSQAGINAARAEVKSAAIPLQYWPVITGQYYCTLSNSSNTTIQTYSLSAEVSLFDGWKDRAIYREAQANKSSAEARAAQMRSDITADVKNAYLTLTNAQQRLAACQLSVEAAQQNFVAQQGRYQNGMAIPLDLLNAELNLTTAQSSAVQSRYDYLTALAQLHYALGQGGEVTWE